MILQDLDYDHPYQRLWNRLDADNAAKSRASRSGTLYASQRDVIIAEMAVLCKAAYMAYAPLGAIAGPYRILLWKRRWKEHAQGTLRSAWA